MSATNERRLTGIRRAVSLTFSSMQQQRPAIVWVLLAMLIAFALLFSAYSSAIARQRRLIEERANLLLDVTQSAASAHLRNNRYHPERLAEILEGIAGAPGVLSVQINTHEGKSIAEARSYAEPDLAPAPDSIAVSMRTVSLQELSSAMGRRGGPRGPQEHSGWMMLPPGPHQIVVWLDRSEFQSGVMAIRVYALIGGMLIILAGALVSQAIRARRQHAALQTELVIAGERAAHLERLAHMGAGLAHETKNPLSVVRGMAQRIQDSPETPDSIRACAGQIVDESDQVVGRIDAFLRLSRPKKPHPEVIRLTAFLENLLGLLRAEAADRGVQLERDTPDISIHADPELLRQAVFNLLINALHACEHGDCIHVAATQDGQTVRIAIRDTGCGIQPEDLPRVTDPYFSRFPGGAGLGLALVADAANVSGWRLHIASKPGQGTEVSLDGVHAIG